MKKTQCSWWFPSWIVWSYVRYVLIRRGEGMIYPTACTGWATGTLLLILDTKKPVSWTG